MSEGGMESVRQLGHCCVGAPGHGLVLDHPEDPFNRIQLGRVGRQTPQFDAQGFEGRAGSPG